MDSKQPKINVEKYISRSKYEGEKENIFEVELIATNNSENTHKFVLNELIPSGFEMIEKTIRTKPFVTFDRSKDEDGILYGWRYNQAKPKETFNVKYKCRRDDPDVSQRNLMVVQGTELLK